MKHQNGLTFQPAKPIMPTSTLQNHPRVNFNFGLRHEPVKIGNSSLTLRRSNSSSTPTDRHCWMSPQTSMNTPMKRRTGPYLSSSMMLEVSPTKPSLRSHGLKRGMTGRTGVQQTAYRNESSTNHRCFTPTKMGINGPSTSP